MFSGLTGWHVLVVIVVLLVIVAMAAGGAVLIAVIARKAAPTQPAAAPQLSSAAQRVSRLAELDVLHQRGLVTESEFEAKRAQILAEI